MHIENNKSLKLSRQAAGTLGKVVTMVEKNEYCPEIIQQIDSVMGLLRSCKRDLLLGHLDHCLEHKLKENKAQTIKELMKIYNLSA